MMNLIKMIFASAAARFAISQFFDFLGSKAAAFAARYSKEAMKAVEMTEAQKDIVGSEDKYNMAYKILQEQLSELKVEAKEQFMDTAITLAVGMYKAQQETKKAEKK